MTKDQVKALREKLQCVLDEASESLGFALKLGNATVGATVTFKLECSPIQADGTAISKEAEDYKRNARLFKMDPEWLDKEFTTSGGRVYRLTGLALKSRKFPILAQEVTTGVTYKLTEDGVRSAFLKKLAGSTGKRLEAEILKDLLNVECALSPENLCCDGETSRAHVARQSALLNARKRSLIAELGRTPTEDEIWALAGK